jgi:hypothetical protein
MVKILDITTVEVAATEEITPSSIKQFLITSLLSNNIIANDQSYCRFTYFKSLNLYEIYLVNSNKKDFIIEPDILINFYKDITTSSSIDLFILDNYFAIFQNKKLYTFKQISGETTENILTFVEHYYKIKIDNTYTITQDKFNKLKDDKLITSSFRKLKDDNLFNTLIIFAISCFIIFSFILYTTLNGKFVKTEDNNLKILNQQYKMLLLKKEKVKINTNQITPKITKLFSFIKLNNITIKSINYKKNLIKLDLFHASKQKLLNFLTIYPKDISVERIEYIKNLNNFKMAISIEL